MSRRIFPWLYLGLGLAQAGHSIEEVLGKLWMYMPIVTGILHERLSFIPRLEWSGEGFAAANLAIVALLLGLSPFVWQRLGWAWRIARVVAVFETLNGLGHVMAALGSGVYIPGCISGVALVLVSLPLWAVPHIRRFPNGID